MLYKVCVRCKEEKPYSDFHVNNSRKDKLQSYCKPCNSESKLQRERKQRGEPTEPEPTGEVFSVSHIKFFPIQPHGFNYIPTRFIDIFTESIYELDEAVRAKGKMPDWSTFNSIEPILCAKDKQGFHMQFIYEVKSL